MSLRLQKPGARVEVIWIFIRIIHCHKKFVGEMIIAAEKVIARSEIYAEASKYGLNRKRQDGSWDF